MADGAALGVTEGSASVDPATLTVGASAGAILEFNNVTNTSAATLTPTAIVANGAVNDQQRLATATIGGVFPLMT